MRPVPQIALDFIKGAEALKLVASPDLAGNMDIGYGHDDPSLKHGDTISEAQADSYLFADTTVAAGRIATCVSASRINQLSDHQYAALVSFAFNLGFSPSACPTLIRALNSGQFAAVPPDLMLYDKAHVRGQLVEVAGLYNRRAAEVTLWKTADVGAAITVAQAAPVAPPSSAFTRQVDTPPAAVFAKPLLASKRFLGTCALGVMGTCKAALGDPQSVQDAVKNAADNLGASPLVAHSMLLQHANGLLTGLVATLAVGVPAIMLAKKFGWIT